MFSQKKINMYAVYPQRIKTTLAAAFVGLQSYS